jgi:hypothetical protein
MTLLDAPIFNEARSRKRKQIIYSAAVVVFVLFLGWWFVTGMPIAGPWNWNSYLRGTIATNHFFAAVEKNDIPRAYGVWMNDPDWQKHPATSTFYPYDRFQQDWSPGGDGNEYGSIHSHKIVAKRMSGNVLIVAVRINDRKSHELFLAYDVKAHTLGFSANELYLGP